MELRESPAALGFATAHIVLNRSLVHSGAIRQQRRTFAVMGNEVNISARLMTAAWPGQIWCRRGWRSPSPENLS
jgi:class 3 adenylate cyclase